MRIVLAALITVLSLTGLASAAPAPQPLGIILSGQGAEAERLDRYSPGQPIDVTVRSTVGTAYSSVALIAAGPLGSERFPLVRRPDGTFVGRITLGDEGAWSLRVQTAVGGLQTATAAFDLNLAPEPDNGAFGIALTVGIGIFFIFGGIGWLIWLRVSAKDDSAVVPSRVRRVS